MPLKPVGRVIYVSFGPIVSDSDFKTLQTGLAYNAAGLKLTAFRETATGVVVDSITPANGITHDYGWDNMDNGMYSIRLPAAASGGGTFGNDAVGVLYLTGSVTGGLPFRSAVYDVVAATIYDGFVTGEEPFPVATDSFTGAADTAIAAIAAPSGSGARLVTIHVVDASNADLQNATVTLTINGGTTTATGNKTTAAGLTSVNVDDADWLVSATCSGYDFTAIKLTSSGLTTNPTTIAANDTITVTMTAQTIPASSLGTITGYLYVIDKLGNPKVSQSVTWKLVGGSVDRKLVKTATDQVAISATGGLVSFVDMIPGCEYRYRITGSSNFVSVTIPADQATNYRLPDLIID